MTGFKIKVCGITRATDARLAAKLGTDMLGLIFYRPSPRFVAVGQAREILRSIPCTVDKVGVFVDEEVSRIARLATQLRLDYVQLHGTEPPGQVAQLRRNGLKVIKAFRIKSQDDYEPVYQSRADLVLLDNCTADRAGGTGKTFDWKIKPPRRIGNLVLAGGIGVDNVREACERFHPLVLDVNSSVEDRPGKKSADKLREFFDCANRLRCDRMK